MPVLTLTELSPYRKLASHPKVVVRWPLMGFTGLGRTAWVAARVAEKTAFRHCHQLPGSGVAVQA